MTSFNSIYDRFLNRISDDMYLEYNEIDTIRDLQDILMNAIPRFEFPRFDIFDYEEGYYDDSQTYQGVYTDGIEKPAAMWVGGFFNSDITEEEKNILSMCMVTEWLGRQLATTKLTAMQYSGSDYKLSSQANHIAKLKTLLDAHKIDTTHLQRLYSRRIRIEGEKLRSTMSDIVSAPDFDIPEYNGVSSFWSTNYDY